MKAKVTYFACMPSTFRSPDDTWHLRTTEIVLELSKEFRDELYAIVTFSMRTHFEGDEPCIVRQRVSFTRCDTLDEFCEMAAAEMGIPDDQDLRPLTLHDGKGMVIKSLPGLVDQMKVELCTAKPMRMQDVAVCLKGKEGDK